MGTAEDLLRSMDINGIDKAVVQNIGWVTHEMCERTNDYILETAQRYPSRLVGFCAIQPLAGDKAVRELQRCRKSGARGIGELRPDIQAFNLCDPTLMGLVATTAVELGMIFSLHSSEPVGHRYEGKGDVTPQSLYKFIEQFPRLNIVLAHFGGGLPFYGLMPEVHRVLQNTWCDTAAAPYLYQSAIYSVISNIMGRDKIVFGSDWPLLGHEKTITHVRNATLNGMEVMGILGNNAARILFHGQEKETT
jgi:predicted TIM-barrel fold metal-dependent hydrolase